VIVGFTEYVRVDADLATGRVVPGILGRSVGKLIAIDVGAAEGYLLHVAALVLRSCLGG
jgi:hypothetical protein